MKAQKRNEMGVRKGTQLRGGNRMFSNLNFIGKWKQWYRVLRYRKGFGRLHSVQCGLWLARG
jgi:hypothetical protein